MSLAAEDQLVPLSKRVGRPKSIEAGPRLNISVVFTSVNPTLAALQKAAGLATRLAARITLLAPQVVPYPRPLEGSPESVCQARRFHVNTEDGPIEMKVQLYPCRDRVQALISVLKPHSLVVLGGRKRWWPTWETRLAKTLRRAGHEVIFAEAK
jgi:hypothetical protein